MGNYTRGGYHSSKQAVSWRGTAYKPKGKRIGIELELEHTKGYRRLLELLPDTKGTSPITERDGSLTDKGGLEIIFPPYSYSGIRRSNSYFRKALTELSTDPPRFTQKTGMHMNINTTGWSVPVQKMFVSFLNAIPNAMLLKLGGRRPTQYCRRRYVRWADADQCKKPDLAWMRPNRIEARFPAATLDMDKISNLITLFDLVEEFVRVPNRQAWFSNLERQVDFCDEYAWYMQHVEPQGFKDMSTAVWAKFKEFVNAKPKTKNIKAFLAATG